MTSLLLLPIAILLFAHPLKAPGSLTASPAAAKPQINSTSGEAGVGQSFLGNSFTGKVWVQNNVEALAVREDGLIFSNSSWDETGREAGIYCDGRPIGMLEGMHSWGRSGGAGIALADGFVFAAMSQAGGFKYPKEDYPPPGENWFGVARFTPEGQYVRWQGGRGYAGAMAVLSKQHPVTGMTRLGNQIAVAIAGEDAIFLLNPKTMEVVARWEVKSPGAIATWGQSLWCIPSGGGGEPFEIAPNGKLTGRVLSGLTKASAIAGSADRLYVADGGPSQQIVVFDSSLREVDRIGVAGGVFAEPRGELGEGRFGGISALAVDARNGNLIVAENGGLSAYNLGNGLTLSAYTPGGKRLWQVQGLEFLDRGCVDPADETAIITKDTLYRIERSLDEAGPAARPVATTLDRFRFPQDPRLYLKLCSTDVVRVNGHKLMGLIDQRAGNLALFRFDGNTAVPVALFSQQGAQGSPAFPPGRPGSKPFRWQDANGNGQFDANEFFPFNAGKGWAWHFANNGDVWFASERGDIFHYPLESVDNAGIPRWAAEPTKHRLPEGLLKEINRIVIEGDTLYVGGYSAADPKPRADWGLIGTRLVRIDHFPNDPKVAWNIRLTYDGPEVALHKRRLPKALDVEDGLIFVGYVFSAEIEVFDAADGRLLTTLRPGPAVDSLSGWFDIPYAIRAHHRKSGDWLVIAEEVSRGKNLLYQFNDPR
jgi:hypothetical protein